jgi:UPF0755 protein
LKTAGLIILFLITAAVVGGFRWRRLYNHSAIHPGLTTDLYLYKKTDIQQLDRILVDSLHLANNKDNLDWAARILGWQSFKPGHYKINHNYTYNAFLSKLAKGNQDPISLTIIPGRHRTAIFSTLADDMRFDSTAIFHVLQDSAFLAKEHINDTTLVGHLLPNTYKVYWTSSPQKLLTRIFNEFNKKVTQKYSKRMHELNLSENQVLALASIIQGEARHNDEKPKISALYWNRLKKGMKLQADPTVEFALKKNRRLTFKDYKIKSPYNTYLHTGLPPGPINNPSLSSIKAALYPADNDYLYMVARPDGYHAFAKTCAKHQRQAKKWRDYLKKQVKKAAKDSTIHAK